MYVCTASATAAQRRRQRPPQPTNNRAANEPNGFLISQAGQGSRSSAWTTSKMSSNSTLGVAVDGGGGGGDEVEVVRPDRPQWPTIHPNPSWCATRRAAHSSATVVNSRSPSFDGVPSMAPLFVFFIRLKIPRLWMLWYGSMLRTTT